MGENQNFILSDYSEEPSRPLEIECPSCVDQFLSLFEDFCVVGCCDWDAINLTDEHFRAVVSTGQATQEGVRMSIQDMLEWTRQLSAPCVVKPHDWYYDPKRAAQALTDALIRLEAIS